MRSVTGNAGTASKRVIRIRDNAYAGASRTSPKRITLAGARGFGAFIQPASPLSRQNKNSRNGRRSESIGIYRLNFRAIQAETERGPRGSAFPETGNYADFLGLNVSVFRISMIIARSDLKFASNNRHVGTPEENKAFVEGSIAYFGTYSAKQMT